MGTVINFNAARLTKHGNVVIPKSRMVYPALFEAVLPKGEKDPAKAKFGAVFLIPKGADLKVLNEVLAQSSKEKFGRTKGVKSPLKKTEESKSLMKYSDDYPYYIRAQSNYQPAVVAPDGVTFVTDKAVAYGGRWAAASIVPFAWSHPTGGDGVSLSLNSVQLLDHADKIGGTIAPVEDEFVPANIDGGEAPDTGGFGNAAEEDEEEDDDFLN
jgi:hypothetical protein